MKKSDIIVHIYRILQYKWRKFSKLIISDERFLKRMYYKKFGKKLNLENPNTYNEKIQWIKLYDKNPKMPVCADKFLVRRYVKARLGKDICVPLIGVYENPEHINFDELPEKFVLKVNFGSGYNIICQDKEKLDFKRARRQLKRWMKTDYSVMGREWLYKNIKPKIVCEQLLEDTSGRIPHDYKIFCFNGKPKYIKVDIDRFTEHKRNIYDTNWNYLDFSIKKPKATHIKIEKPKQLDDMLEIAEKLSKEFLHVRVDYYIIDDTLYLGELSFHHASGFGKFYPKKWDRTFGDELSLKSIAQNTDCSNIY